MNIRLQVRDAYRADNTKLAWHLLQQWHRPEPEPPEKPLTRLEWQQRLAEQQQLLAQKEAL